MKQQKDDEIKSVSFDEADETDYENRIVDPDYNPADAETDKQLLEELNHRGLLGV